VNPFTRNRRRRSQSILDLLAQHPEGMEDIELWLETPWTVNQLVAALKPLQRDGRVITRTVPGARPGRRPHWKVTLAQAEETVDP
jgi:hypothetical protein